MDENNDGYVTVGETIQYEFNVTNTGNVALTNVTLSDNNANVSGGPIEILVAGASDTTTFSAIHTITEQDLIDGKVLNQATIIAEDPDGNIISDISDDPLDPVDTDVDGNGDPDDPTSTGLPIKDPVSTNDTEDAVAGESVNIDVVNNDEGGTFVLDPLTVTLSVPGNATDVVTDADGDVIGFVIPGEGIWSVDEISGVVTFTPIDGYVGDPTPIEYTIEDTQGNPASAMITINYPPVAHDDSNTSLPIGTIAVLSPLANDQQTSETLDPESISLVIPTNATDVMTDADGDVIGFVIPGEGRWYVDERSGIVTFEPSNELSGNPTPVNYTVRETNGDISNEATLMVTYFDASEPAVQSIGDQFWIDSNGNNRMDEDESPVVGAVVELLDANGNSMVCPHINMMPNMQREESVAVIERANDNSDRCIVETDENGRYEFVVDPGSYQVRFTLPQEIIDTQYTFVDMHDPDIVIQNNTLTYAVDIAEGETNMDIDAAVSCGCAGITSDSADAMNLITILFMLFGVLYLPLFLRRKEGVLGY